jgi:hypothetical protein
MDTKEDIVSRLDALIHKADAVLATHKPNPPDMIGFPTLNFELFSEWQTQSLSYLINLLGSGHTYVLKFEQQIQNAAADEAIVSIGKGILKAAREDVEKGYLKKIQALVSAAIFGDFLEMAEYLLSEGYKDPAASLSGAVLEDRLRRIAVDRGIKLKSREDIGSLNQKLADANVYNRLTHKKIQVWKSVRDNADHGKFSEYEKADVSEMVKGVRDFLERYL